MDDKQITQALQAIAQQEIPDDMNIWPQIKTIAQTQTPPRGKPILRLVKATALIAIFVAVSAATYAFYQQITNVDPGIEAVDRDNKIIYFAETQPVQPNAQSSKNDYGLTVTLDYAYADANRITVSFTARGKASASDSVSVFSNPALTDANGQEFYRMPLLGSGGGSGSGGGGGGSSDSDPMVEFSNSLTSNFDASGITGAPANINVHLTVDVAYVDAHSRGGMLSAGTTTFDFSLPFNPGRSADVVQTVTAGGLDMMLRKVIVSPSLTRLEMCYEDPSREQFRAVPYGTVAVNGKIVLAETELTLSGLNGQAIDADDACRAIDIPAALQNEDGAWTISITRLRLQGSENLQEVAAVMQQQLNIIITPQLGGGFGYDTPPNADEALWNAVDAIVADAQDSVEGPWTFTFDLP